MQGDPEDHCEQDVTFKEARSRTETAWGITQTEKSKLQQEVNELKEQLKKMLDKQTGDSDSPAAPPTTPGPVACPATVKCNTAAAVTGSLIAGFVLGAVVTYCVQLALRRRNQRIPPKDYAVTASRQYDVNRNNDGSIHITPAQSRVKEHKKLERLVTLSQASPGDSRTTPATAPLISSRAEPTPTTNQPSTPTTNQPSTPTTTSLPPTANDLTYANIGAVSMLSHPYDTLDIIPEESEYENSRSSIYEGVSVDVATK